jgi:hypothetical protein
MNSIRAGFYARVSSEQQATAHTIESQITALSERAQTDGFAVPPELGQCFHCDRCAAHFMEGDGTTGLSEN